MNIHTIQLWSYNFSICVRTIIYLDLLLHLSVNPKDIEGIDNMEIIYTSTPFLAFWMSVQILINIEGQKKYSISSCDWNAPFFPLVLSTGWALVLICQCPLNIQLSKKILILQAFISSISLDCSVLVK